MKSTTKLLLLSLAQGALFIIFILNGLYIYNTYIEKQDVFKKQCFDKFKSFEYEVVSDVLYCKTSNGLIEVKD